MNIRHLSMVVAIQLCPLLAFAEPAASAETSSWGNLFWGVLPILLIVGIFIPMIRRIQNRVLEQSKRHMERQLQHMERVEQSLERITKALENRDQ